MVKIKGRAKAKIKKVLHEYKAGNLHSASKKGTKVQKKQQALAIALSEAGIAKKK